MTNLVSPQLSFTTFTNQGWVVAVLNVCMFVLTTCFFEEVTPEWADADASGANGGNGGHGALEERGGGGGDGGGGNSGGNGGAAAAKTSFYCSPNF